MDTTQVMLELVRRIRAASAQKKKGKETMGQQILVYLMLGEILVGLVLPALKEAAKKTPNPADDLAISALESALMLLKDGNFKSLIK